jgi:hypothetical protein
MRGVEIRQGYEHPYLNDIPIEDVARGADQALAKAVGETLFSHYFTPGWWVEVSHKQGIVKISIPALMGPNDYYVIKIVDLETDPNLKSVMRVGGEIFERYKIPRSGFSNADFEAAISRHPLGYRGLTAVPT